MNLLCRIGIHTDFPKVVGRWYVNGRCTPCAAHLRPASLSPNPEEQS